VAPFPEDARADATGKIEAICFQGSQRFTTVERAIRLVEREGSTNAHVVHPASGKPHLRTNPDASTRNNLDEMAEHAVEARR
jgi:hypothetical protein